MVSVILPAYNAEKYIERCVKSVLSQSCPLFELIIVNDGSTDQTVNICKKLCEPYNNCFILEQNNSGVSAARNRGLSQAKGEWIVFLDSDDYLEPDYVETVEKYSTGYNVDFLLFNFTTIGREQKIQSGQEYVYNANKLLIDGLMRSNTEVFRNTSLNSPWAKAYRLEMIRGAHLHFDDKITMGEDILFNLSYYLLVKKFVYVDRSMYNYQFSKGSLARKFNINLIEVDRAFHERMLKILEKQNLIKHYESQIGAFLLDGYLSCLKRCLFHPENPQDSALRFRYAKELTGSAPYCGVLRNRVFIREHCKRKDRILLHLAKNSRWRIIELLIRMCNGKK